MSFAVLVGGYPVGTRHVDAEMGRNPSPALVAEQTIGVLIEHAVASVAILVADLHRLIVV